LAWNFCTPFPWNFHPFRDGTFGFVKGVLNGLVHLSRGILYTFAVEILYTFRWNNHIKVLQECELFKPEPSGREIYYHFNPKKMQEIDNWIDQFRKIWETQFNQLDKVLSTLKKQKK
jgi:hypothetical protein